MKLRLEDNWALKWAREMTKTIYGLAPKKKMGADEFAKHIEAATQYGFVQALEQVILAHEIEPAETGDLLIGDCHVLLMNEYNRFRARTAAKAPPASIETIMARAAAYKKAVEQTENSSGIG